MTDRHDWNPVQIIKTYHGQSSIEQSFRELKNPSHLSLKPQFHWTDQKIVVHYFICVLGYLLATIAWRQAKLVGFRGNLSTFLDTLNNIRLATILEETTTRGRVKASYKLEEMSPEENLLMEGLQIKDLHLKRLKFTNVGVYN